MAAYTQITSYIYYGLSTDTKPTGVALLCKCYETNTKKWFVTADGTNWVEGDIANSVIAGYVDTEVAALTTELAKVPKSDSTVSWNATALTAIQTACAAAITAAGLALASTFGTFTRALKTQWGTRWDTAGDLGADIQALIGKGRVVYSSTLTTSSATAPADSTIASADTYQGCRFILTGGTYAGLQRQIVTHSAAGVFTFPEALLGAPGLVTYVIVRDYDWIRWLPVLKDTGDLEAATKTISATAEASGVGNADYTSILTAQVITATLNGVSKTIGTDLIRELVIRIGTRLSVTIDSDDGTHDLRCRVYVDAQDANHMLYDVTCTTTGSQINVQDCLVGTKEVIFNLLKDGASHTFYFFFWSPGNHSPVISVVNLWHALGTTLNNGAGLSVSLKHSGLITVGASFSRVGSGTASGRFHPTGNTDPIVALSTGQFTETKCVGVGKFQVYTTTAGDLGYFTAIDVILRSD